MNENYSKKALAYSFLAHIRNSGTLVKGPLEIFVPLVKKGLHFMNISKEQYKGESINEIYKIIVDKYSIDIPIPVLRTILRYIANEVNKQEKVFELYNDDSFWIKDYIFEDYDTYLIRKEKEIDSNNHSASAGVFAVSDDELAESLDRDRKIEDVSKAWGLPCNEGNMIKARDWAREYSLDWLLRAIETAGNGKEQTWRYVGGILKSWKENGGPDAPRKQRASPAKVVSAQQYTQRQYTEDELLAVSDDLLAEARANRGKTA